MRITRAAKVAAFPLIVLALVALVACQGGPGTKGDKGDKGDMGKPGHTGGPGVDTLTARGTDPVLVIIDNVKNVSNAELIGSLPGPMDMSVHFRGGYGPITYSPSMVPNSTSTFIVDKLDKDTGILTIKLRTAGDNEPMGDYTIADAAAVDASVITVRAKDVEGNFADRAVHILTNKAPTVPNPTTPWAATVGTEMRADKAVLACSSFNNSPILAANTAHQCTLDATTAEFLDDTGDTLMLSVVGASSKAFVAADGFKLTITGLASTWNPKGGSGTGAHEPAEVMIRATDRNDLSVKRLLAITVDAAPAVKRTIPNRTLEDDGVVFIAAVGIANFFSDDSNDAVTVVTPAATSDSDVATALVDNAGNLAVTPLNSGTATITVTGTEGTTLNQQVKTSFTVTVTAR